MSSLKEIAAEAVAAHDLLGDRKEESSEHNSRRMSERQRPQFHTKLLIDSFVITQIEQLVYLLILLYIIVFIESRGDGSLFHSVLTAILNPAVAAPGSRLDNSLGLSSAPAMRRETPIQPLLGVAPLGPVSLSQDKMYQLKMLESAFKHLPEPSDSERVR